MKDRQTFCQQSSHLVLQVILPVHLMVRDVKVVIGVVVLKHTAGGRDGDDRKINPHHTQHY